MDSSPLQLGILFHQLLQAEARKLYSNLGFFAFSFALVDRPLAIFGMPNLLARPESALAGGLFDRRFWHTELLPARGKELGNVLDGVVGLGRSRGLLAAGLSRARSPACALVLVFVGVVRVAVVRCGTAPRWTGKSARPHTCSARAAASAQLFNQRCRHFFQ